MVARQKPYNIPCQKNYFCNSMNLIDGNRGEIRIKSVLLGNECKYTKKHRGSLTFSFMVLMFK